MNSIQLTSQFISLDDVKQPKIDSEKREIDFIACRECEIKRYNFWTGEEYILILDHSKEAVDLSRVKSKQCVFLEGHTGFFSSATRIGKVIEAKLESGELVTKHRISKTKAGNEYWQEVLDDTQPGLSIEANITKLKLVSKAKYEETESEDDDGDTYRRKKLVSPAKFKAVNWQLLAISSVDIPAIVGTRKLSETELEQFSNVPKVTVEIDGDESDYSVLFQGSNQQKDRSIMDDDKNKSDKTTQLADENRDLKVRLSQAEKDLQSERDKAALLELKNQYFQLRNFAVQLWAIDNKLTEEEYTLDFSEDSAVDIERLSAMSSDDAKIELKTIDRALRRASLKNPIERVPEADRGKLENTKIVSKKLDAQRGSVDEELDESTDTKKAEKFLEKHTPRKIG